MLGLCSKPNPIGLLTVSNAKHAKMNLETNVAKLINQLFFSTEVTLSYE